MSGNLVGNILCGVMQNVMSGEMCEVSLVGFVKLKNVDVLSLITAQTMSRGYYK